MLGAESVEESSEESDGLLEEKAGSEEYPRGMIDDLKW
jgi:hypothetical protein